MKTFKALSALLTYAPAGADIDLRKKSYKYSTLSVAKNVTIRNGSLVCAATTGTQVSVDPSARFVARNVKFTGGGSESTVDTNQNHHLIAQIGASSASRGVGLDLESCEFSGCGMVAVYSKFSDGHRFVGNKVSDFAYAGIQCLSCNDGVASKNRVEGREAAGIFGDAYGMAVTHDSTGYDDDPNAGTPRANNPFSGGWLIIGNTVIAPKRWEGIDFHGGYRNIIAFNKVHGGAMGLAAGGSSGDATGYAGHDTLIMGNIVTSKNEDDTLSEDTNPYAGIVITGGGATPVFRHHKVIVTGNTVEGYGGVDTLGNVNATAAAIYGATGTMSVVISDNVITEWAACAINLSTDTGSVIINDNVFSGTRESQEFDAVIKLLGNCPGRIQIVGNVLDDIIGTAPALGVVSASACQARITYGSDFRRAGTELALTFTSPGEVRQFQYT